MITVICPTYNEKKYIVDCIESVLQQDYPKEKMDVLFVDGMSNDGTREIIEEYSNKYNFIHLIDNPNKFVPYAMNLGIKISTGEYIIRLDAHAAYPINYFSLLIKFAKKYNTDNIGGVCLTDVKNNNVKTGAIKTVLSHKFGVGNAIFRIGSSKPQVVDTVPFGCFKRDVFEIYGEYDERLIRNQDIELNRRIKRGGGKIMLIPEITCTYFARETFAGLAKNNYENGLWNMLTVYYTKNIQSLSLRHFVPLLFVLSILLPLILSIFVFEFIWLSLFSLVAYVIMLAYVCLSIKPISIKKVFFLVLTFFVLHVSYGCGSIVGVLEVLKMKMLKTDRVN